MADLEFIYGVMSSGKTTKLLQDRHNYLEYGKRVAIVKPGIDTKGDKNIVSKMGSSAIADIIISDNESFFSEEYLNIILLSDVILVDEAQFLTIDQVDELWKITKRFNIPVICYGLKSDFTSTLFDGTQKLIGLSDTKSELTVRCKCGKEAVHNARMVNGKYVLEGEQVSIDNQENVSYVPLCGDCFYEIQEMLESEKENDISTQRKRKFFDMLP